MKDKLTCALFGATVLVLSLMCWLMPKSQYSESERRVLAKAPTPTVENVFSGAFASDFEKYATDTFPQRDTFRSLKAYSSKYLFAKSDNNKLFSQRGHLSKLEYPLNEYMLDHAADRIMLVYDSMIRDSGAKAYFSVVPDKNYFLDTLRLDYDALVGHMCDRTQALEYIDIFPALSLDDYYTTDTHWRQERLGGVADIIADAMAADIAATYTENTLDRPFYGVYCGQSAMKTAPDTIHYLTNDILDGCTVKRANDKTGMLEPSEMYDMEKATGRDAYEMFLSGNSALLTIQNPAATSGRDLVVFRDSFGSALVPLLVPAYRSVTMVDLRYIQPEMLPSILKFGSSHDVLFLYSTVLLNNSLAMK